MAIAEIKDRDLEFFNTEFQKVHKEISKVIVGYSDVIDDILMTILARGHALLEGVPGLGKTKLVQTLSDLSLIHISEPTRLLSISYAVFCLKKKTLVGSR